MLGPKMQMVIQFCQRGLASTGWQTMRTDLSCPGLSLIEASLATICRVSEQRIGSSGSRLCHPAGDLTRAKQSRAGNRLWLFKLPISCYSSQRMLRQLLGIVDAMCCTSVSRQLARLCTLTMLLPAQSSQLGASGRLSGFRAASAGWLVVPRSNRGLHLLAHHESCGSSSRQRNRYISDLSCLSASHVCVYTGTRSNNPIAGFLFRKSHLIAASPLAGWLRPGSGRQLFLFW